MIKSKHVLNKVDHLGGGFVYSWPSKCCVIGLRKKFRSLFTSHEILIAIM